jgi:hypothetical protein
LKSELDNKVKQMAINSLKTTKGLNPNTKKNLINMSKFGLQIGTALGVGVAYDKTYDYFDKQNTEKIYKNLEDRMTKTRIMRDITDVTQKDLDLANDH